MALQAVRRETSARARTLGEVNPGRTERGKARCSSAPQLPMSKAQPSASSSGTGSSQQLQACTVEAGDTSGNAASVSKPSAGSSSSISSAQQLQASTVEAGESSGNVVSVSKPSAGSSSSTSSCQQLQPSTAEAGDISGNVASVSKPSSASSRNTSSSQQLQACTNEAGETSGNVASVSEHSAGYSSGTSCSQNLQPSTVETAETSAHVSSVSKSTSAKVRVDKSSGNTLALVNTTASINSSGDNLTQVTTPSSHNRNNEDIPRTDLLNPRENSAIPGPSTSDTAMAEQSEGISGKNLTMKSLESALQQDKIEIATITDMINEQEFVQIPSRRLAQMRQLLGSSSISSSTDGERVFVQDTDVVDQEVLQRDSQIVGPQDQIAEQSQSGDAILPVANESQNPSETRNDNTSETANSSGLSDQTETEPRIESSSDQEVEGNLEMVEDHFIAPEEVDREVSVPDTEDTDAPNIFMHGDISSSPPSVGGFPSTTPPPSYAECMKDAIPLSFIDFWPQCVNLNDENFLYSRFETFDRVIDAANLWLQEHPNIVIRNCETTEVKASSLDEFILQTAAKASTFRSSFRPLLYIRGLRIWYSSKIINKLPFVFAVTPCVLSYKNIKHTLVNVGDHLEYESMAALVEKCNSQIREGTIKGRILNVESVCIKEPDSEEDGRIHLFTDPDESTWRDSYFKTARYILRVFFLPDQPAMEKLIFKDFLPENSRHSRSHPKYRDFTSVMDDCRLWLVHLSSCYRVINAQTLEVKHVSKNAPDTLTTFISDFEGSPRVRFLRVYYAEDLTGANVEFGAPLLSHKTFIPALLKKRRHETLASLMHRVETWLRATGATVVCAETLAVLQQAYTEKKDADFSLYRSEWMEASTEYDHETLLYVVRVYLDTVYPEPPPQIFLDGEEDGFDEDCCIL